jgi:ATP-dependent helicase/nuclease subunit B
MRIRFDPDFDGGAWPGPLEGRDAASGVAWLGVLGLLDRLENAVGLAGPAPTAGERAARLVPGLRRVAGFWSRSTEVDPLGSARELLRWRDELVLAGWDGAAKGMPARVASMAQLAPDLLPGLPDRLRAVEAALARRSAEVGTLELLEPVHALPRAWQTIIRRLETQGTAITEVVPEPASAQGDLAAARGPGFAPTRDGSLQLLRSDGPWAAAVEVSAWLSAHYSSKGILVVSPTPLLDTELRRFGLPATGASQVGGGSALLEVLPLVIALGWKPAAPEDAAALLSLPESPVPHGIRNRLRRALSDWPAVGSLEWRAGLEAGLAAIEEPARRERVTARLQGIFDASVARGPEGYPVAEIRKRIALVRDWLRARRATLEDGANSNFARALGEAEAHCFAFARIVDLADLERWSATNLQRFLDESRASLAAEPVLPAEAGVAAVASPSAVVGPARCVVWWDFSRGSAPGYSRVPFTAAERAQLATAGVVLPAPGDEAIRNAARWRRPLDQTREHLLLVSPRTNEAGEESHPHPLWDEITARIDRGAPNRERFLSGTLYAEPRPTLAEEPLRPAPRPLRIWKVPAALLELPVRASNSAIEDLLRCPMKWALGRLARLEGPGEIEVGISNLVLGRLAHLLLEDVLPAATGDPSEARRLAERWFEEHAPTRVVALFLPGREADSARIRRILADAAGIFTEFVRSAGLELRHAETEIEGSGLGRTLFGIPDLVLGPKPIVVDAKWGGFSYRRDALKNGTATQLAFYAHLLGQQSGFGETAASVAFFVLSQGRIVTTDSGLGSRAEAVDGPSHAETWLALERAFDARREELSRGVVLATANPDKLGEGVPTDDSVAPDGAVVLAPKCQWCEYGGLCGATLAGAS